MKKIFTLFTIVLAFQFTLSAQSTFQKVIAVQGYPDFISTGIHQCSDGGFLLCGYDGLTYAHGIIVKMNSTYQVLWVKEFTDPNATQFYLFNVGECIGGGYYANGYTYDYSNSTTACFLLKLDISGNTTWARQYDLEQYEVIYGNVAPKVKQLPSGEFIITTATYYSMGIIKTDANGNIELARTFTADSIEPKDPGLDALVCNDGGILCAGKRGNDPYFVKIDATGNVQWSKTLTMTNFYNRIYRMLPTSDGGYLLAGMKFDLNTYEEDGFLMKMDSVGNTSWYKEYSCANHFYFTDMKMLSTGDLLLMAFDYDTYQPVIIITDVNGAVQSSRSIAIPQGPSYTSYGCYLDVEVSSTDDVLLTYSYSDFSSNTTTTYLFNSANLNFNWCDANYFPVTTTPVNYSPVVGSGAVVHPMITLSASAFPTSQNGSVSVSDYCLNSGINNSIAENNASVFPNPFSSSATIEVNASLIDNNTTFILYDMLGNEVEKLELKNPKTEIERGNLSNGIYLYKIISSKGIVGNGKIILED
jgi:hypothetical protein